MQRDSEALLLSADRFMVEFFRISLKTFWDKAFRTLKLFKNVGLLTNLLRIRFLSFLLSIMIIIGDGGG
jgi:hypothetical protein